MTDRELLELAAKAAGIMCSWAHDDEADYSAKTEGMWLNGARSPDNSKFWNPLTDDGDALRLAGKLYIGVRSHGPDHWQQPNLSVALWDFDDKAGRVTVEHGDDPQRATRRAIVHAAAAVGRAMP